MSIQLGSAYGKVNIDASGVKKAVGDVKAGLNDMALAGAQMGETLRDVGDKLLRSVTLPILAVGAASLKAAEALQISQDQVKVVFSESSDVLLEWSKTAAKSFGQSKRAALDGASALGTLFGAADIGSARSAEMSMRLVELAADIALLKKAKPEDVIKDLISGMAGNSEVLLKYGINLDKTGNVQQRYERILRQTADMQGYFDKTTGNARKGLTQMRAELEDAAAMLGENLLPLELQVVEALNSMLESFNNLSPSSQKFVLSVGGLVAVLPVLLKVVGTLMAIKPFLSGIGAALPAIGGMLGGLSGVGASLTTIFGGLAATITGTVIPAIAAGAASVAAILGPLLLIIATVVLVYLAFKNNFMGITTTAKQLWFIIKWVFQQGWNWLVRSTQNALNQVLTLWRRINWSELGRSILQGLINGMLSGIGSLVAAVKRIVDTILGGIKRGLGIHSPSQRAMELGQFTAQGYIMGMQRSLNANEVARMMARPMTQVTRGGDSMTVNLASGLTLRRAQQMMTENRRDMLKAMTRAMG